MEGLSEERKGGVEAVSLSVPAHISSRSAGMHGDHSKPITKLIK